jgi:hypothetical protein
MRDPLEFLLRNPIPPRAGRFANLCRGFPESPINRQKQTRVPQTISRKSCRHNEAADQRRAREWRRVTGPLDTIARHYWIFADAMPSPRLDLNVYLGAMDERVVYRRKFR